MITEHAYKKKIKKRQLFTINMDHHSSTLLAAELLRIINNFDLY